MSRYMVYECDYCASKRDTDHPESPIPPGWMWVHFKRELRFGGPPQITDVAFCSHDCAIKWLGRDKEAGNE